VTKPPQRHEEPTTGELRRRAVQGVLTLVFRGFGVRALGLVGTVVVARFLSPSQFGLIALGMTLVTTGRFIAEGGLAVSLIRRPEPPTREQLQVALGFQLLVATLVALLATAFVPLGTAAAIAAIMAWSLPIDALRTPAYIAMERDLSYGFIARLEITETFVYNVVAIVAVVAGFGVYGVAGAVVIKSIAAASLLIRSPVGLMRPRWNGGLVRSMLGFGVAFQAPTLLNLLRDQVLNVVIASVAGTAALGIWSLANRLLLTIRIVLESLWRVTYPAIARLLAAGSDPKRLVGRSADSMVVATGFAVVAIAAASQPLVQVLFGGRYATVADIVPWLAVGMVLGSPLYLTVSAYLQALGDARRVFLVALVKLPLGVAISAGSVILLGVRGAVIGILAAGTGEVVYYMRLLVRRMELNMTWTVVTPVAATVAAVLVGREVAAQVGPDVAAVVAAGVAAEAVYLSAMIAWRREALRNLRSLGRQAVEPRLERLRRRKPTRAQEAGAHAAL
jgi:O-antigen/teichoic acid export membrane protein